MDKLQNTKMTEQARAERIQYLKDLFRLSFRTHTDYNITMENEPHNYDYYDQQVDFMGDAPAGFNDADLAELEEFREDFEKLNALDVYQQLCIDYYQDVINELDYRAQCLEEELKQFENDDPATLLKMNGKSRARYEARYDALLDRIELNQKHYEIARAKLQGYTQGKGDQKDETIFAEI